jgi:cobaltochelatase CobN
MLRGVIRRHLDPEIAVEEPEQFVELGIYHPAAPHIFTDKAAFAEWQERQPGYDSGRPRLALLFYSALLSPGQQGAIDFLVFHLEQSGFLVTPCFGPEQQIVEEFLLDERGAAQVDLVLSFSLKFTSALSPQLAAALRRLDVPLFSAISLYRQTLAQWRQNGAGIAVEDVAWTMAIPEISGLVEPTVLLGKEEAVDADSGRSWYISRPVVENVERLLSRLHGWIALQRKANSEKKLAILFYNHHQGKQNVGASYLNVFASLEEIFAALERDGYHTGPLPDEPKIKELILRGARNIGSWAPGELEVMIGQGDLELLERDEYEQWFAGLPAEFQDKVVAQWGRPGDFQMMLYQGKIVIPMIRQGNIVVLPEPARGWSDDPMKLYHDTTLYPHHQYLAVYLWLAKKFGADAMIHLGTHATYEWTPGKQSGLSPLCSPEVLVTDIPNLYPYIVDNVGEAIQAKRRGRGVMLSHLTPTLRRSELYQEYAGMAELAGEIEYGAAHGSAATVEKLKELRFLVDRTGILSELLDGGMAMPADQDLPEMVSHYLEEIKEEMIPFGMHTYGRARQAEEIAEMVDVMAAWNPDVERKILTERIVASAGAEMQNLLHGLNGRYVEPGEGNDPLRNPHAIPTGPQSLWL